MTDPGYTRFTALWLSNAHVLVFARHLKDRISKLDLIFEQYSTKRKEVMYNKWISLYFMYHPLFSVGTAIFKFAIILMSMSDIANTNYSKINITRLSKRLILQSEWSLMFCDCNLTNSTMNKPLDLSVTTVAQHLKMSILTNRFRQHTDRGSAQFLTTY